ncbi:class 1 isoprenoid biosynthesis enzyme [Limibacter armeniacum]|uniref:class 1 isoprenoid biosynthesis enzyme n=1 Tax=Limibacter armeniacum TaxID=466084 RepID=UPI002FE5CC43
MERATPMELSFFYIQNSHLPPPLGSDKAPTTFSKYPFTYISTSNNYSLSSEKFYKIRQIRMHSPSKYYWLLITFKRLLNDVSNQKQYIRTHLKPQLESFLVSNDGSIDEADITKMLHYYAFGVPSIVGEGFCTLRGFPMSPTERACTTLQGALTGIYDDLFDRYTHLDPAVFHKALHNLNLLPKRSSFYQLCHALIEQMLDAVPDINYFHWAADKVYQAQVESLKQHNWNLTEKELLEITLKKGGDSLLFYRSAFGHPLSPEEREAIYSLGGLMQLGNDIFDTYKDLQESVQTLMTSNCDIQKIRKEFSSQLDTCVQMLNSLPYPVKNKHQFIRKLLLGISRCFVCLDQFETLQRKNNGKFIPQKFSRKQLICDMEKPQNLLKSMRYYLQYCNL